MAFEGKRRFFGKVTTTTAAATPFTFLEDDGTPITEIPILTNSALALFGKVIAVSTTGVTRISILQAGLKRGAGALSLVSAADVVNFADAGAAAWAINAVATAAGFRVDVTGAAGVTIEWRIELEFNLLQP